MTKDALITMGLAAESLHEVLRPITEASGLPNAAYRSQEFAEIERDSLLAETWTCIGVGAQVPEVGDIQPVRLLDLPLIMLRDRGGEIRVFHNVCSHRGMELVTEPCNAPSVIRCPYHSWCYGLDGALRTTPFIGGPGTASCEGFERARHGLKPVRSALWADSVFVNLSGEAPAFADFIAPLAERWRDFDLSAITHGGADSRFEIEVACNWKLAVENFCEAYHLPWIHPGLNSYSRLEDHYNIELEGRFSGQGSVVYNPQLSVDGRAFPHFPDLPEHWLDKAEYIALYPNVLFGIHADHFWSVCLIPLGPARTLERFEIYYLGDAVRGADYEDLRAANARQWQQIFEEDRGVVEGMQRGRASPAFSGGAFSPVMDGPTHCFHKWAAAGLLRALYRDPYPRPELAASA